MNLQFEDCEKMKNNIIILLNNLKTKEIQVQKFFPDFNLISKSNINYIYKIIKIFCGIPSIKKRIIFRYINYLNKKIINQSSNKYSKYQTTPGENTLKIFLLIYMIVFIIKISFKRKNDDEERNKNIQRFNKNIFYFLEKISTIIAKLYLDKTIDIISLEMIFKILIIFSINDNLEIKEKNDIENIMYLKECLKIIKIIYKNNSSEEEQNLLIDIFRYMNSNICYIDKDNKFKNYTNKFFLLNNDNSTTKLISLMSLIYEIDNSNLTKEYFEFLSNIYFFQFNYNNLNWPLYGLIEPLLVNIDKKKYETIRKEISYPLFLFNFIKQLTNNERLFINEHSCILKNGFYFGGKKNNQNGIIAEIDSLQDNFILTFGFKLFIKDRKEEEYTILQFKTIKDMKTQLKISILNNNNLNCLTIVDNKNNKENIFKISEEKYYIFSIQIKGSSLLVRFCYDNSEKHEHIEIQKMSFKLDKVYLCVGCDIEKKDKNSKDKSIHNNYNYINKFTGFIGDIHIINTKYIDKDIKDDIHFYQRNFLNLNGKYGQTIVKSINDQKNLDEYVYSNLDESTSKNQSISKEDIFKIYIPKGNKKSYKIIDNIALYISSFNFKLTEYMDDIDYKNYDNKYYEKEKFLKETKKELQFYNNFRIKSNNLKPIILEMNTKLFNCNFNIFENKSGITKFIEEDGIFFLILILEYYYQVIFRISKEVLGKTENNDDDENKENNKNSINDKKNNKFIKFYNIYSFNFLSKEQNKILECIGNGIKIILQFFLKKILNLNIYVKYYKSGIFFNQINIVLKQYLLIKDLDNKIYELLLNCLEAYQKLINKSFNHLENANNYNPPEELKIRNFFFEFLLNPELYREKNENVLSKLKNLFDLLNRIINDNHYNDELYKDKIFKKIIMLKYIFYESNNKFYKEITKSYLSFLSNYINKFYFNSEEGKTIINFFYETIEDPSNAEDQLYFCFLSFALLKCDINFYLDKNYIENIKSKFSEDNSKLNNISFIMILCEYYLNDSNNITNFKQMLIDLKDGQEITILVYLLDVFRIFMRDDIKFEDLFYEPKNAHDSEIGLNMEKLSKTQEKYFENFLALLSLFIIDEDNIEDNYRTMIIYNNIKNYLLEIVKLKQIKLFKNIFSSENSFCPKLYFKLLSDVNNVTTIENDIIKFTEELITYHNNPFIFELIKQLNNDLIQKDDAKEDNNLDIEFKKKIINIVINIIDSIYKSLKNFNYPDKNRKLNKYYIRGIINLFITINNICEMKEKLYLDNEIFLNIFVDLIKLAEQLQIIYINYCIKINERRGKLLIEIIFDSFIYIINSKDNSQIKELFNKLFIRSDRKKTVYFTLFYLMDILKRPNIEQKLQNQLLIFNIEVSKIKKLISLLKTKKKYKMGKIEERRALPNYKCVYPIENTNISIYFISKTYLFLKKNIIKSNDFKKYLFDIFLILLNQNIFRLRTTWKNYYDETINDDIQLYVLVKEFYDHISNNDQPLEILFKELPFKLKSKNDIDSYNISIFIWNIDDEGNEVEKTNDAKENNELNIDNSKNINNKEEIKDENIFDLDINKEEKKELINETPKSKSGSIKIDESIKENKKELKKIKDSFENVNYYNKHFGIFDDINNRCFIYNPKNALIKRLFSHIFYRLIFYDKTFMYIKYKYLRKFPTANIRTKQLNFPSKIKNFSNIYEPKLFLKKDFNFYEPDLFLKADKNSEYRSYFQISHDFLIKEEPMDKKSSKRKEKETKNLIDSTISLVNFYEHYFNIYDILDKEDQYFDCELVTGQYVYFGYIILNEKYFYFGTKDENPVNYKEKNNEEINIDSFLKFCFSNRNRDNKTYKKKRLIIFYKDIKLAIKRRILLMYQAIEIFCYDGKSYFFNLYKKKNCEKFFTMLTKININLDSKNKFKILNENNIPGEVKTIQHEVKRNIINNYMFLSKINFYSSRTFNDLNQYPIFPWIILNFDKLNILLDNTEKRDFFYSEKNITNKNINNNDNNIENNNENENKEDPEKENNIIKISITNNQDLYNECGLRVFNYPLSMQTKEKREHSIEKFVDDLVESEGKFVFHHGAHYSTASYVYFFLMRNNPFTQCMIKLQNYDKENPNRLFVSYKDTINVFNTLPENRELIPNLFCHFDYYTNLNCAYNGTKSNGKLVDDLYDNSKDEYSQKMNSIYLKFVFLFRKLLNSNLVSRYLPQWIDNIFGKNQLPDNPKKLESSCNIFNKSSYEQKMKLNKKIEKYIKLYNNKELKEKDFVKKVLLKIDMINNFGMTPHKVLEVTINLKTSTELFRTANRYFKINKGIYFINSNDEILILFKNEKDNIKKIASWNIKSIFKDYKLENLDKKNIYPCGYIKRLDKYLSNKYKIPIFKPCYSMTNIFISNKLFIFTCRYLGNIFKVMISNSESYIDVLCEDFVTCITCYKNIDPNLDDIKIYTGLKNGKIIEWVINPKDEKITLIKERKNCFCHKGEITCIELYENQNIIITAGKDKKIFIRKIYNFELLTVIDLTYLYGNNDIIKEINIVPTLIKVSELNCVYVMIYNYNTKKSFIRAYNLNGLFIAQTEEDDFMNICFTKNCSLIVSCYNKNKFYVLNSYDLEKIYELNISEFTNNIVIKDKKKKEIQKDNILIWMDYNYRNQEFTLLFEDKIIRGCIQDKEKQLKLASY